MIRCISLDRKTKTTEFSHPNHHGHVPFKDHGNVHLHGAGRAQDAGEHGDPLFGEAIGEVLAVLESFSVAYGQWVMDWRKARRCSISARVISCRRRVENASQVKDATTEPSTTAWRMSSKLNDSRPVAAR